jgi:hypothetical protein
MVVSVIFRVMMISSRSQSWFGFQVGLGVAAAVLADLEGIPEVCPGARGPVLDPVAGGDDDHVVGGPAAGCAAGFAVLLLVHAVACCGQMVVRVDGTDVVR